MSSNLHKTDFFENIRYQSVRLRYVSRIFLNVCCMHSAQFMFYIVFMSPSTLSGFCLSVGLSASHTFLVVTHSYVSQVTHAFLGMLPLCYKIHLTNVLCSLNVRCTYYAPVLHWRHIVIRLSVHLSVCLCILFFFCP